MSYEDIYNALRDGTKEEYAAAMEYLRRMASDNPEFIVGFVEYSAFRRNRDATSH